MKSFKIHLFLLISGLTLISFFFLSFIIQPSLHHHLQQTAWLSGSIFRDNFFNYAGGPAEYISLFISQFFGSDFIAGIIIALTAALIVYLLFKTFLLDKKEPLFIAYLLPIVQVIIIAFFGDYRFHFSVLFNLLITTLFIYLSEYAIRKFKLKISFQIFLFSILIYYFSGGMYFLIFMLSSLLLSIKKPFGPALLNGAIILVLAIIIPLIAYNYIFDSSLYASFFKSTPDVAVMLRYTKQLLFYLGLASIPGYILFFKISEIKMRQKKVEQNVSQRSSFRRWMGDRKNLYLVVSLIIIIGISFFVYYDSYQPQEKLKVEIDYYAYHKDWDKVLELSEKVIDYDRMVNFQFNRAISHKGQMLEKLFDSEQLLGSQGLFLDQPFAAEITLPNSDLYFDLGNIDESLRLAFESQTLMPESPRVLKRLITDCIIQGKMNAAHTYLNVLEANPVESEWAKKYMAFAVDKSISSDREIERKRNDMVKAEGIRLTPRAKILSLMERNPQNKAAFEYIIAFDLMEHDMSSFLEDLKFFPALRYPKIPKAMEEAILLFQTQRPNVSELFRYWISPETISRFRDFASLTNANSGNREKAKQATIAHKNTYWYYVLFQSPLVTNLRLDTQAVDANY